MGKLRKARTVPITVCLKEIRRINQETLRRREGNHLDMTV